MTKELKADISLVAVTVFWGLSFPIMSVALKTIPPYSYIAIRYTIGAIILGTFFRKKLKSISIKDFKIAGIIGVTLLIGIILQVVGLTYTTSSKSAFITGLNVVFVPIMLAVIYKKLPDYRTIIGIILSIIGLYILSAKGSSGINFGDFLTLLCSIVFAAQIILVDKYAKEVDSGLLTTLELFIVGILSFIPAIGIERLHFEVTKTVVMALVITIIFSTVIAMWVQNEMQPYTNPTHAAIIYLGEPVFGAIFSIFIGDKLTGNSLIGSFLIFLGMIVINVKVKLEKAESEVL